MSLYNTRAWRRRSRMQLRIEPTCRLCAASGEVVAAQVADHITPFRTKDGKEDINLFYGPTQSLCVACHSFKTQSDARGFHCAVGLDGLPTDPRHPVYRATSKDENEV